jgi:hypothetical protein
MFWISPISLHGLTFSIFSYDGRVRVGVMSNEGYVRSQEGLQNIVDAIEAELTNTFNLNKIGQE